MRRAGYRARSPAAPATPADPDPAAPEALARPDPGTSPGAAGARPPPPPSSGGAAIHTRGSSPAAGSAPQPLADRPPPAICPPVAPPGRARLDFGFWILDFGLFPLHHPIRNPKT